MMTDVVDKAVEALSIEDLEKNAKANPDDLDLRVRWGWALYAANQYASARSVFEDAHTRWPDDIEVNYALGLIYRYLGEDGNARKSFENAVQGAASDSRTTMLQNMAGVQLAKTR